MQGFSDTGCNILCVGAQGRGKTNFNKNLLATKKYSNRDNHIFDPNQEYNVPNKARNIFTRKEFLDKTPHQRNANINAIFSEAGGFFSKSGSIPDNLVRHICRRFWTGNLNIFDYLDLTQFNSDNLIYVDYIILFRTQGKPSKVYESFNDYPNILMGYEDVQKRTAGTVFDRYNKTYHPGSYINKEGKKIHVTAEYSKAWHHYYQVIKIN